MNKIYAALFVATCLTAGPVVHAEDVVIEGKTIKCALEEVNVLTCIDGIKKYLVLETNLGYSAITTNNQNVLISKNVSRVSNEKRVLFESPADEKPDPDTKNNRLLSAKTVIENLKNSKISLAKEFLALAQDYLKSNSEISDKLEVKFDLVNKDIQCQKGETRRLTDTEISMQSMYESKIQCDFYTCKGIEPNESILAFFPGPNSFQNPYIIKMKNGQAQLITDEFKVFDGGSVPLFIWPQTSIPDSVLVGESENGILDSKLFIPSKYDQSQSSFPFLINLNDTGHLDFESNLCGDEKTRSLLLEQKKIAREMKEHLAEAEIIEFLKLIDGNIHSFYIDKKKGSQLGCMYDGKILDQSVLGDFNYLKKISLNDKPKRYLSIDEVQNLFNEAKNMKDIPFGYKYDGCYARAHLMARRFEEKGISTQKAWIKGDLYVPGTDIRWNYHVAPVVEVMDKDGSLQKYVIDPSLTEKAVPLNDWVASMGKNSRGPVMKTTYPFPSNGILYERTVVAISSSEPYGPFDLKMLKEEDKILNSLQVLREFSSLLAADGGN